VKITKEMRKDAIEILRCCADEGRDPSDFVSTFDTAESLGHERYGATSNAAADAWDEVRFGPVFSNVEVAHSIVCLEAAAWLEEGGTP